MNYKELLNIASQAAKEAGEFARQGIENANISMKDGDQIVTQYDSRCQDIIIAYIHKYFPKHGLIAEEGPGGKLLKQLPHDDCRFCWVIDPIDGTRNFAHGLPNYSVSIGILEEGEPVAGVIYDPNIDVVFTACKTEPARCNQNIIHCHDETLHANSQLALSGNVYRVLHDKLGKLMADNVCMNLGSAALHFAYVAKGAYAGALGWNLKLWDIAGGAAICRQAGGEIINPTDFTPCFPFDYRNYQGETIPVIMAAPAVQEQLRDLIAG